MDIVAGDPGGNTEVTMSPNFAFPGISARYAPSDSEALNPYLSRFPLIYFLRITSCKVSSGVHELYPIHTFQNNVCFDSSRKIFRIIIKVFDK